MTREEIIQAIAITSGFAGIEEFEYCESIHCMTLFIKWYENDIAFRSQGIKKLGEKVISFLNNKMNNNKTNKTNNINNKTNNKMKNNNLNNTNCNSKKMNYRKLISISLEEAKEWYNSDNDILKALVLKAFKKEELESSFRDIKTFEDACNALGLKYDVLYHMSKDMRPIGRASVATFKLNIIRKALNLGQELYLTKNSKDSVIYNPFNPIVTGNSSYYKKELEIGTMEVIGKFQNEDIIYTVLGGKTVEHNAHGLGCFESHNNSVGYAYPSVGFLGCATKEIAKHFGKYFGMLITEAKFGDLPGFTIINSKYNN